MILGAYEADAFENVVHELVVNFSVPIVAEAVVAAGVPACALGRGQVG